MDYLTWGERIVKLSVTKELLQSYNVVLRKRLGQNLLVDPNILDKILDLAQIREDDCILEIGPGLGALTQELVRRARGVVAVEYDRKLCQILKEIFAGTQNLIVINADLLSLDLAPLAEEHTLTKVVSNLPYNIASTAVLKIMEECSNVGEMTVMVQREVAERMAAAPGSAAYGSYTLKLRYFAQVFPLFQVPRTVFLPLPEVNSTVVKIRRDPYWQKLYPAQKFLFEIIDLGFSQRRKKLVNSLCSGASSRLSKENIVQALRLAGIDILTRAEELSLEKFVQLCQALLTLLHQGSTMVQQ
jgi:16S rRNA (adenine1518-N6/adenine1519-N6)-dimethyltransferase